LTILDHLVVDEVRGSRATVATLVLGVVSVVGVVTAT
jgi:hypothetical protein